MQRAGDTAGRRNDTYGRGSDKRLQCEEASLRSVPGSSDRIESEAGSDDDDLRASAEQVEVQGRNLRIERSDEDNRERRDLFAAAGPDHRNESGTGCGAVTAVRLQPDVFNELTTCK